VPDPTHERQNKVSELFEIVVLRFKYTKELKILQYRQNCKFGEFLPAVREWAGLPQHQF